MISAEMRQGQNKNKLEAEDKPMIAVEFLHFYSKPSPTPFFRGKHIRKASEKGFTPIPEKLTLIITAHDQSSYAESNLLVI